MGRMTECCCYIPLREGCLAASVIEFMIVISEIVIYILYYHEVHEDEKAVQIVEICNTQMCALWLFFGSLKEERVCIILHNFFISIMLVAEFVFEVVAFKFAFFIRSPDWLIAYHIIYHGFLIYMICVCFSYAIELREKTHSDSGLGAHRHRTHRLMSSALSSEIYGM